MNMTRAEIAMLRAFARACIEGQATTFITAHTVTEGQDIIHALSNKTDEPVCGPSDNMTIVSTEFARVNCDACLQAIMEEE